MSFRTNSYQQISFTDCTGGYNNFTDLKGFFQLVKQITSNERDIMANDTPYKN